MILETWPADLLYLSMNYPEEIFSGVEIIIFIEKF